MGAGPKLIPDEEAIYQWRKLVFPLSTKLDDKVQDGFLNDVPPHPAIYIYFDNNGDVAYIGSSSSISKEVIRNHHNDKKAPVKFCFKDATDPNYQQTSKNKACTLWLKPVKHLPTGGVYKGHQPLAYLAEHIFMSTICSYGNSWMKGGAKSPQVCADMPGLDIFKLYVDIFRSLDSEDGTVKPFLPTITESSRGDDVYKRRMAIQTKFNTYHTNLAGNGGGGNNNNNNNIVNNNNNNAPPAAPVAVLALPPSPGSPVSPGSPFVIPRTPDFNWDDFVVGMDLDDDDNNNNNNNIGNNNNDDDDDYLSSDWDELVDQIEMDMQQPAAQQVNDVFLAPTDDENELSESDEEDDEDDIIEID